MANSLPVVVANRTGFEASPVAGDPGIQFWGQSFIAGPQGEMLAQASSDKEENLLVDIDLQRTEQIKRIWPYFRDRRIDAYADSKQEVARLQSRCTNTPIMMEFDYRFKHPSALKTASRSQV